MRRAWMLVLLSVVPVSVALAHLDSTSPDAFQATYEFQLDGIRVSYEDRSGVKKPRGFLYAHVQVWVETHDPGRLVKTDYVYGPRKFRPTPVAGGDGFAQVFAVDEVLYTHVDCTGPEGVHASIRASLMPRKKLIPAGLRAPNGAGVMASVRKEIADVLAKGRTLPSARGSSDPGAVMIEGTGRGRLEVEMGGRLDYTPTDTPCGADPEGGSPPTGPTTAGVEETGFEHPTEKTDPDFYSAVCGTVVWDPPTADVPASAVLEVLGADGRWTQVPGAEERFTTDATGRREVRFGINEANRKYRIGVVVGTALGESGEIDVGAGSPPRQTRDCYPP